MKHNVERNGVKWCDKPAGDIVVLSNLITKQPLVVESKYEQKFQFKPAEFSSTVSIFWKQWDETSRVVEEDKEEITREGRKGDHESASPSLGRSKVPAQVNKDTPRQNHASPARRSPRKSWQLSAGGLWTAHE